VYAYLKGTVERKTREGIELDVNGVGYLLSVPLSTYSKLPSDGAAPVKIFTHMHVRDDAIDLYGFLTLEEKQLFELLLSVTGVGPKVALAVLSGLTPARFRNAIMQNDVAALSSISGIGKKTAQRMILEVKNKLGEETEIAKVLGEEGEALRDSDVVRALVSLGCTLSQAKNAVKKASAELPEGAAIEEQIRIALKYV
jgi:Holliday junction DNA helicase RuvA